MQQQKNRISRAATTLMLAVLAAVPLLGQPQRPRPRPSQRPMRLRRTIKPSACDGFEIPAELYADPGAFLATETAALARVAADERHKGRIDRMLVLIVASRLAGQGVLSPDRAAAIYGPGSVGATAAPLLAALVDGQLDKLTDTMTALEPEQIESGWRDLAWALDKAIGRTDGRAGDARAVLTMVILGMPYPRPRSEHLFRMGSAFKAFEKGQEDQQKQAVDALLAARNVPRHRAFFERVPVFLESNFRNRQTRNLELGRLMLECSEGRAKYYRASLLPKGAASVRDSAAKQGLVEQARGDERPTRRLSAANSLSRKKHYTEAYTLLKDLEQDLPAELRIEAWTGLFKTLIAAEQAGTDVGTTLADERKRRLEAARTGNAMAVCARADLDRLTGNQADAGKIYLELARSAAAPSLVRVHSWMAVAEQEPARAWELIETLLPAFRTPTTRQKSPLDTTLIAVGVIQGELLETARVLEQLRAHRTHTWKLGAEAGLRFREGQAEQARGLMKRVPSHAAYGAIRMFLSLTVPPEEPHFAYTTPLKAPAAQALRDMQDPVSDGWLLAAETALAAMAGRPQPQEAGQLWRCLFGRYPATPSPLHDAMAAQVHQRTLSIHEATHIGGKAKYAGLLSSVQSPLQNAAPASVLPHIVAVFGAALRASADLGMPETQARTRVDSLLRLFGAREAGASDYAALKTHVAASYPGLAAKVAHPEP